MSTVRQVRVRLVTFSMLLLLVNIANAATEENVRNSLFAIEVRSHQQWLESDLAALDRLMAPDFRFVAMNGAVETKADVIGGDGVERASRPLQVTELRVETEELVLIDNLATVLSLLHLEATVRGRPVPPRMRIMSVYTRECTESDWRLISRSITPILPHPARSE